MMKKKIIALLSIFSLLNVVITPLVAIASSPMQTTIETDPYLKENDLDVPSLNSNNLLKVASMFHIFANEASLSADTNGNLAVETLHTSNNFGTRGQGSSYNLTTGDVYYIQNITSPLSSNAFRNTQFNRVVLGSGLTLSSTEGKVIINGTSFDSLLPDNVLSEASNNQYINFGNVFESLIQTSKFLSDQQTSSEVIANYSDMNNRYIDLSNGSSTSGITYVNIPYEYLTQPQPITIRGLSSNKSGKTVVINVLGQPFGALNIQTQINLIYDDLSSHLPNSEQHNEPNHVLWNFGVGVQTLNFTSGRFMGSILAPNSTINAGVNIDGNLVANIVNIVGGETHRWDLWSSTTEPSTTEPSTTEPSTTVYVQKQWRQLSNQSLPDTLNVTVQRKVADGSLDLNWQQTLVLKKADNWKASFTAPAYNNQGQSFSYVVKSEDASGIDLSSFISSQNMDQQTATLTLTNQQYGFQFQKKTTDGTDLSADQLKAMQFNLIQYSDNSFQQVSKTNAITSTDLQALAPGYYGIQEASAPTGYQLDGTTYLFQLTSDGQWQYHGTKDNVTSGSVINGQQTLNPVGDKSDDFTVTGNHQQILTLTKYDEPKPSMTLRVIKQDNQSQYLAGAAFTLQPSAGEAETITSSATSEGQAFATKLIADGTYTMSETKAPDGYQSNPAKIAIQVATTGKGATVTIDGEALKPGESKNGYTLAIDGSTITLQAINQPLAILPHLGGQGYQRLLGIALGLISAAFLLLLVVLIKRRVVKQHD